MKVNDLLNNKQLLSIVAKQIFIEADTNNNGYWDQQELYKFFQHTSNVFNLPKFSEQDAKNALERYDVNKDG